MVGSSYCAGAVRRPTVAAPWRVQETCGRTRTVTWTSGEVLVPTVARTPRTISCGDGGMIDGPLIWQRGPSANSDTAGPEMRRQAHVAPVPPSARAARRATVSPGPTAVGLVGSGCTARAGPSRVMDSMVLHGGPGAGVVHRPGPHVAGVVGVADGDALPVGPRGGGQDGPRVVLDSQRPGAARLTREQHQLACRCTSRSRGSAGPAAGWCWRSRYPVVTVLSLDRARPRSWIRRTLVP